MIKAIISGIIYVIIVHAGFYIGNKASVKNKVLIGFYTGMISFCFIYVMNNL